MTVPAIPLPKLSLLCKAIFTNCPAGEPWGLYKDGYNLAFYSRGMWAIAEAVSALLRDAGKKKGCIWLPDYICNDAVSPLRSDDYTLVFYPINDKLRPDWDTLERMIKLSPAPDILLLVHYFGFQNDIEGSNSFCKRRNAYLLEDAAHILVPTSGIGCEGSAIIFSPRKLLPIPEGGLLVMPKRFILDSDNQNHRGDTKLLINWLIRRLAQRIMLSMGISWHKFIKQKDGDTSQEMPNPFCNIYTLKLLSMIEPNLNQIIAKRRRNYKLFCHWFGNLNGAKPLFPQLYDDICPYAFALIMKYSTAPVIKKLRSAGIPASSWPNLPPEVLVSKEKHPTALWLQRHIMLLPVHQDLSEKQICTISQSGIRLLN